MEEQVVQFRQHHIRNKGKVMMVRNSWGIYHAYKAIRKNHWYDIGRPLKESEFYSIVRNVNRLLAENIAAGIPVKFPERMGEIELIKFEVGASIVGGKLKVTYPIDWKRTWELWFRDAEAHREKTLVRNEQGTVYHAKYIKDKATYENKIFYQFVLNRGIKTMLKKNIKEGKTDTLYDK